MSIAEIIPVVRALSRDEKYERARMRLADLANGEPPATFKAGQVFPIYTPECAPNTAAQLGQLLEEERNR